MKNINLNVISDKSVLSSIKIMNKYMNSFYKLMNVLFLLLLVFGSCGVSFGMKNNQSEDLGFEKKSKKFNDSDSDSEDNKSNKSKGITSPVHEITNNEKKEKGFDNNDFSSKFIIDNKSHYPKKENYNFDNDSVIDTSLIKPRTGKVGFPKDNDFMYVRTKIKRIRSYSDDMNPYEVIPPYNIALLQPQGWGIRFGNGYGLMQYPNDLYSQDTNCLKCDTAYSKEDVLSSIYHAEGRMGNFINNLLFDNGDSFHKVIIRNEHTGEKEEVRDMGKFRFSESNVSPLRTVSQVFVDEQLDLVYESICRSLYSTAARSNVMKLPILAENYGGAVGKKTEFLRDLNSFVEASGRQRIVEYNKEEEEKKKEKQEEMFNNLGGLFKYHISNFKKDNILNVQKNKNRPQLERIKDGEMIDGINREINEDLKGDEYGIKTAGYLKKSVVFKSAMQAAGGFAQMAGLKYCIKKAEDSLGEIRLYAPYLKSVDDIRKRKKQNGSKQVNNDEDLARELDYHRAVLRSKLLQKYNDEISQSENVSLFQKYNNEIGRSKKAQKDETKEKIKYDTDLLKVQEDTRFSMIEKKEDGANQGDKKLEKKENEANLGDKESPKGLIDINIEKVEMNKFEIGDVNSELMKIKDMESKLIVEKENKEIIPNEQENNKDDESNFGKYAMNKLDGMMESFISGYKSELKDTFCVVNERGGVLTREGEYLALLKTLDGRKFDDAVDRLIDVHKNMFFGFLNSLYRIMDDMGFQEDDKVNMYGVNTLAQLLYDNGVISGDLYRELKCYVRCRLNEFCNVFEKPDTSDYQKRNYGYRGLVYSSLGFVLSSVLSGIGGENNTWTKFSFGGMSWDVYRSNIFTSFGINVQIPLPVSLPLIDSSLNIHVVGVNFMSLIISGVIFAFLPLRKIDDDVNTMINAYIDSLCRVPYSRLLPNDVIEPGLFRGYNESSYIGKIMYYFGQSLTGNDEETKYLENNSFLFVLARRCLFDTLQYMSISIPINAYLSINLNVGWFVVSWIMTGCKKLVLGWKNKHNKVKLKSIVDGKNSDVLSRVDDDVPTDSDSIGDFYTKEELHLRNKNVKKPIKDSMVKENDKLIKDFEENEIKVKEMEMTCDE